MTSQPLNLLTWIAISGYPEIKTVRKELTADTREGHFIGTAVCASVQVGDWKGVVCFNPGTPGHDDINATIASAKACVDYQRAKQAKTATEKNS